MIPGLLGFVDGTNVAIRTPFVHEGLYVNRKGYHAQHVQIVNTSLIQSIISSLIFNTINFWWYKNILKTLYENIY